MRSGLRLSTSTHSLVDGWPGGGSNMTSFTTISRGTGVSNRPKKNVAVAVVIALPAASATFVTVSV